MKKLIYLIVLVLISSLALTGCSLLSNVGQVPTTEQTKVKPTGNLSGAVNVPWNLSADVMPAPPYGTKDEPGSDTASKLIVNQPNGAVEVTITGAMNGLTPTTTYDVRLENGYEPYVDTGWDVTGTFFIDATVFTLGGNITYQEKLILTQNEEDIIGEYLALLDGTSVWTIYEGSVVESAIEFRAYFGSPPPSGRTVHFLGTIAADGTMSGSWADDPPNDRSGVWASTGGAAVKTHNGDVWSQGPFKDQQWFQFTTDANGSGSWHVNLKDSDFDDIAGTYILSVWINKSGASILVSDPFTVVVD